jgi:AmiR/NasT family two-component response regulator
MARKYEFIEVRGAVRDRPDDVAGVLTQLSALLVDSESLDQRLRRVVDLAISTIPGCHAAGVRLVTAERAQAAGEPLESRAVIEQAKGVLMACHGIDADEAFGLLRRQSQHRNVKLREVAHDVVASTQSFPAAAAKRCAGT